MNEKKPLVLLIVSLMAILCCSLSISPLEAGQLIPNPDFFQDHDNDNLPDHWQHGISSYPELEPSKFGWELFPNSSSKVIWIIGGEDKEGEWYCSIEGVEPNTDYVLRFYAYRDTFINKVYPEVELFGQEMLLHNHCTYGGWQSFELYFNSRLVGPSSQLIFRNRFPVKFWFFFPQLLPLKEQPSLLLPEEQKKIEQRMDFLQAQKDFFPLGLFGISNSQALIKIKKAGFNTALIPPQPELIKAASEMDIKTVVNISPWLADPNSASSSIVHLSPSPSLLAWYIADEPELSPFIAETFAPLIKSLNQLDPVHPTCLAMNRAGFVSNYAQVNNIFLLDEYPIPNMPLTWLTESLDQAKDKVGSDRVWAIIQAFGGAEHKEGGWPRFPTLEELRALTYLAIIHEASGLMFFSYDSASAEIGRWEILTKVILELKALYPWLTIPNSSQLNEPENLQLVIHSPYQTDAAGKPAIHLAVKKKDQQWLILAVNTTDHPVEMSIKGLPQSKLLFDVLFEYRKIPTKNGQLRDEFPPFGTHLYLK